MADILTACLASEEATVKALLIGQGQTYVATYRPFNEAVMTVSLYNPPNIDIGCTYARPGSKVLVHTTA